MDVSCTHKLLFWDRSTVPEIRQGSVSFKAGIDRWFGFEAHLRLWSTIVYWHYRLVCSSQSIVHTLTSFTSGCLGASLSRLWWLRDVKSSGGLCSHWTWWHLTAFAWVSHRSLHRCGRSVLLTRWKGNSLCLAHGLFLGLKWRFSPQSASVCLRSWRGLRSWSLFTSS